MCTASNTAQSRSRATNVSFFTTPEPHTCERGRERRLVLPPKSAQARAHFSSGHAPHTQNTCVRSTCEHARHTQHAAGSDRQANTSKESSKAGPTCARRIGGHEWHGGRERGALWQKCCSKATAQKSQGGVKAKAKVTHQRLAQATGSKER